jgi:hypothetical protein
MEEDRCAFPALNRREWVNILPETIADKKAILGSKESQVSNFQAEWKPPRLPLRIVLRCRIAYSFRHNNGPILKRFTCCVGSGSYLLEEATYWSILSTYLTTFSVDSYIESRLLLEKQDQAALG